MDKAKTKDCTAALAAAVNAETALAVAHRACDTAESAQRAAGWALLAVGIMFAACWLSARCVGELGTPPAP